MEKSLGIAIINIEALLVHEVGEQKTLNQKM